MPRAILKENTLSPGKSTRASVSPATFPHPASEIKVNTAIETDRLTKYYGTTTAVTDLSLRVTTGEIYAFLGLNGAGKTTTIRLLLGMVKPTAGRVRVLGTEIRTGGEKPWASVGYLVETADAYPELTVRENLHVMRRLRPGVPPHAVDHAIDRLGLRADADRRAATLSHGNKQRLGLAKALMHTPKLLILDEPANGLDPAGIVEIRALLIELARDHGVTVFMSSHILAEVARLAQRIGIIHHGRLLQELNIAELEQNRHRRLLVRTRDSQAACALLLADGVAAAIAENDTIVISDATHIAQPDLVATRLVQGGHPPTLLSVEEEALEQYFLRLVGISEGASP